MKIPLQYVSGRILADALISSRKYRITYARITFVIDTGSDETFISQGDAARFQLPVNSLTFVKHLKMGGSTYEIKNIREINLSFKKDGDEIEAFSLPNFSVAIGTKKGEKGLQEAYSFPSILGTDFLKEHKLALYFNPSKDVAYLERV